MRATKVNSSVRIASASGFWGDLPRAPIDQVRRGPIDYLVMDYLAEVTMSILQKQHMRDPGRGYARDFVEVIDELLPDLARRRFKVISNAGGINPEACKDQILERVKERGIEDITVAVVSGDDILPRIHTLTSEGHRLENIDTGEPITTIGDRLVSANAYLGCGPVVQALREGADIVVTGRVFDAGLILAAMMHEFDWSFKEYDKVASGIVAGHIIECGAQVSGGNFTDWEQVGDLVDIGFPIIEAFPDGTFDVTKHEGTGGLVSEATVKEQLVYEIADPQHYLTPDGVADFTTLQLEQVGPDRVKVYGVTGKPPTGMYKISASYRDGYKLVASLVYSWPDALKKARKGAEILRGRAEALGLTFRAFEPLYIGYNANSEAPVTGDALAQEFNEIEMRVAVLGDDEAMLNRFGKEVVPLILTGPSGVTGYAAGRPRASEVIAYWPALLAKEAVTPEMQIFRSGM